MSFLEMSMMGGAMILCILLLRALAGRRIPTAVLSAMWIAVLLRLTAPVSIPSPLSFLGFLQQAKQPMAVISHTMPAVSPAPPSPLNYIWLVGAALCMLSFLAVGIRQRSVLQAALPAPMTKKLTAALAAQRLSRPVSVYTSDRISTPLTYGLFRPRIVLPSHMALCGKELDFVLAHECGHIQRGDAAKKHLMLAILCLHWFNPLVWVMMFVMGRDMELNCDRRVLQKYGSHVRASYARTLLDLEERKRFSGILMECFSKSPLEERIRFVMKGRKTTLAAVLAAVLVFGCAATVFATSPGAPNSVAISSVWVQAMHSAADEIILAPAGTAVDIWKSPVRAAVWPGVELTVPTVTVMEQSGNRMLLAALPNSTVKYGGMVSVSTTQTVDAIPAMEYSISYVISDKSARP